MSDIELSEPNVLAIQFDEPALADELARWCGGEVEEQVSTEDPERKRLVIWVPVPGRPTAARVGDWIVKQPDGTFLPFSPEDFVARHEPATLGDGEPPAAT